MSFRDNWRDILTTVAMPGQKDTTKLNVQPKVSDLSERRMDATKKINVEVYGIDLEHDKKLQKDEWAHFILTTL